MKKKKRIWFYLIILSGFLLISAVSCDEDEGIGKVSDLTNTVLNDSTGTADFAREGTIGKVTDIEGNTYKTIVIGTQTWMSENLRTTMLNDGTPIPNVTDGTQWGRLTTPGYCWYANDESANKATHGALYAWYAVSTGKLAPAGWHVATREEWTILISYLGGEEEAGGRMKESGLEHWNTPNTDAINTSGFTALGSGGRYCFCSGSHKLMDMGFWWTATASDKPDFAYYYFLDKETGRIDNTIDILNYKVFGFSVRCVRD